MKELKDYLIVGLGITIIVMFLMKGCVNPFPNLEVVPEQKIIKTETHDTIFTNTELVKLKTVTKFKYDTIYKIDTFKININDLMFTRVYNDSISDSNQTIYSMIKLDGVLNELSVSYKMKKKPYIITNTFGEVITNTIVQVPKMSLYGGLEVGGNKSTFNISPFINLNLKKKSIMYRYDILGRTHNIGVAIKIFSSKR